MTIEPNERPLDARPAARPVPKPVAETVKIVNPQTIDEDAAKPPFKLNLWSINVAVWNVVWILFFLNMGFGIIEQQMPIGNVNVTYNTCSFGEFDGACSVTGGSRVMSIGVALLLTYFFIRGVQKRIKRGY